MNSRCNDEPYLLLNVQESALELVLTTQKEDMVTQELAIDLYLYLQLTFCNDSNPWSYVVLRDSAQPRHIKERVNLLHTKSASGR